MFCKLCSLKRQAVFRLSTMTTENTTSIALTPRIVATQMNARGNRWRTCVRRESIETFETGVGLFFGLF